MSALTNNLFPKTSIFLNRFPSILQHGSVTCSFVIFIQCRTEDVYIPLEIYTTLNIAIRKYHRQRNHAKRKHAVIQ